MDVTKNWKRIKYALASTLAVGAAAAAINTVGCDNSSTTATTAFTTDPYVYYTYYPADISVASYYWAGDWVYTGLYALDPNGGYVPPNTASTGAAGAGAAGAGAAGSGAAGAGSSAAGAGGSTATATPTIGGVVTTVADAIRALARGQDVCGSAVTVAAKTRTPVCTGGPAQSRAGVTITFNNCQTPGGGLITGTVDVSSTSTATSTVCTGTTSITTSHTTTITNLTYVGPNGFKAVIPQQTDTGTNTYAFGTTPPTITLMTTGRLQTYGPDGTLLSDTNFSGTPTISFGGSQSGYTIDGTFNTSDNRLNSVGSQYTLTSITRVGTCCRPVAGTVQVSTGDGDGDNDDLSSTYTFGPTCGDITLDGTILTSVPGCL
jgi:hypothetical protein